ncbi:MAG: TlpA family protein disulfide reductase, partial [Chloroflexi bacterium]|nr:TlpA family protein disulfide reductase [Chloroflexota bacterium]
FVGIFFEEDEAESLEMLSRLGITYPQGSDLGNRISTAYGITGVPETFVLDSEGRVSYVHVGPAGAEQLRAVLDSLLND